MRRFFLIAIAIISFHSRSSGDEPAPAENPAAPPLHLESPYQLSLAVDLPVAVAGLTIWLVPGAALGSSVSSPACGNPDPCDKGQLNALDRQVVGQWSPTARTVSDYYFILPAAFALADVLDVGVTHWRSWMTDVAVVAESLAINGALDEIVRRAVRRPRPLLYDANIYPEDHGKPDSTFSFYSGHTSAMFTLASSLAYTYQLRHPHSKARYAVWVAALAAASVEGYLRVAAGEHFPTDVIVGALVGTSIGVLVPALHRRTWDLGGAKAGLTMAPQPGGALVGFGGVF